MIERTISPITEEQRREALTSVFDGLKQLAASGMEWEVLSREMAKQAAKIKSLITGGEASQIDGSSAVT